MKTLLMHPDRDFDATVPKSKQAEDYAEDIELDVLLDTMAAGDPYLREIAQAALLRAWDNDMDTILYRQEILKDCLANKDVVRLFYELAQEPFNRRNDRLYRPFGEEPSMKVSSSVRTLKDAFGDANAAARAMLLRDAADHPHIGPAIKFRHDPARPTFDLPPYDRSARPAWR